MYKVPLGTVRIISGQWRHRKIRFPALPELRPTQDRIKETLFNWLQPLIEGAVCLDLFAGSGSLGLEALSRGAAKVIFIDQKKELVQYLQQNIKILEAMNAEAVLGSFPNSLPTFRPKTFDIVFIDPPFHENLVAPSIEWLEKNNYLKNTAYIYIEMEKGLFPLPIPPTWTIHKQGKTASLDYVLYRRDANKFKIEN